MKSLLLLVLLFAAALPSAAQLTVHLKMDRRNYLANEQVSATVTITNRSGKELFLRSQQKGQVLQSWLDFNITDGRGRTLHRRQGPVFRAARVPAGQSVAKSIVFNDIFSVYQPERYTVHAKVNLVDTGMTFASRSDYFNVQNGRVIHRQRFGVPKSKYPNREYQVLSFNDGRRDSIYAAVHDAKTGASLRTQRLSEILIFDKPHVTIDGKNRLHILWLANPEVYVHALVSPDGNIAKHEYFKRGAYGRPTLAAFANGEVKVRGGIPYDPKKEAAERSKAFQITDRPGQ